VAFFKGIAYDSVYENLVDKQFKMVPANYDPEQFRDWSGKAFCR
jgi:hypothetical protein